MSVTPQKSAPQARLAAIVIAAAFTLWMLGSWAGGLLGLPARFAFLLDMAAMAALLWALVVLARIWLASRRADEGMKPKNEARDARR